MRNLARPDVLLAAGCSAAGSTLLCLPRLAHWTEAPLPAGPLATTLFVTSFFLWSFVYAWTPAPGFAALWIRPRAGPAWLAVLAGGAAGFAVLEWTIDPTLRRLVPGDYPPTYSAWVAQGLFHLGLDSLFLGFAPFAFFHRLSGRIPSAAGLTLAFGLILLYAKLRTLPGDVGPAFGGFLFLWRLALGAFGLWLFLRGGILPALACTALLQLRHLLHLPA